ncbi:hypothetical protein HDU96_007056 [Phlyctochytrium bullatum]|nr:hypothetical protein HDU96_007056 [Phlyctochytrium bullatum]
MSLCFNLCSQLANSYKWKMNRIAVPDTKTNRAVAKILYEEGFISSLASGDVGGPYHAGMRIPVTPDNVSRRKLWLDLKYRNGEPVLRRIKAVSIPSRRIFASLDEIKAVAAARRSSNSLLKPQEVGQVTVLNTMYGIVELKEALRKGVGGEVLLMAS